MKEIENNPNSEYCVYHFSAPEVIESLSNLNSLEIHYAQDNIIGWRSGAWKNNGFDAVELFQEGGTLESVPVLIVENTSDKAHFPRAEGLANLINERSLSVWAGPEKPAVPTYVPQYRKLKPDDTVRLEKLEYTTREAFGRPIRSGGWKEFNGMDRYGGPVTTLKEFGDGNIDVGTEKEVSWCHDTNSNSYEDFSFIIPNEWELVGYRNRAFLIDFNITEIQKNTIDEILGTSYNQGKPIPEIKDFFVDDTVKKIVLEAMKVLEVDNLEVQFDMNKLQEHSYEWLPKLNHVLVEIEKIGVPFKVADYSHEFGAVFKKSICPYIPDGLLERISKGCYESIAVLKKTKITDENSGSWDYDQYKKNKSIDALIKEIREKVNSQIIQHYDFWIGGKNAGVFRTSTSEWCWPTKHTPKLDISLCIK